MAGTGLKCMKCGRIFRQINGSTTKEIQSMLNEEQKEKFFGDDFFCCGKENLKSLYDLGMMDKLQSLQREWMEIFIKRVK